MPAIQESKDHRIVVGVDGSPSSREALRWAVQQAALTGSAVDAVIAWHDPASYAGYGWLIADTSYADLKGHPARVLLDAAEGGDLLVVGNRGHGGFAGMLLGSVSQHCVNHSPCPVVVIRGHRRAG
jgi:nucleotide-binding universal stress UspA family protein